MIKPQTHSALMEYLEKECCQHILAVLNEYKFVIKCEKRPKAATPKAPSSSSTFDSYTHSHNTTHERSRPIPHWGSNLHKRKIIPAAIEQETLRSFLAASESTEADRKMYLPSIKLLSARNSFQGYVIYSHHRQSDVTTIDR
jgi:hypothetical protein